MEEIKEIVGLIDKIGYPFDAMMVIAVCTFLILVLISLIFLKIYGSKPKTSFMLFLALIIASAGGNFLKIDRRDVCLKALGVNKVVDHKKLAGLSGTNTEVELDYSMFKSFIDKCKKGES